MNDVDRERDSVSARLLFRYITVDEWRDYRAVMTTFAGTFFAELTPEDVHRRLTANGFTIDPGVIADRLERSHAAGAAPRRDENLMAGLAVLGTAWCCVPV